MSIKIQKPGRIKSPWQVYSGKCANCGCEFTCDERDGQVIQDREAATGQILLLQCPTCRRPIHADGPVKTKDKP